MLDSVLPEQRKVVLVLRQLDIDKLSVSENAADVLHNDEVNVLRYPPQEPGRIVSGLVRSGLARPGAVLVQSPFNQDIYRDSAHVVEECALDKFTCFSELCMLLGARRVSVEQITMKNSKGKLSVGVKVDARVVSGEAKVNTEDLDSLRKRIVLEDTFPGDSADVEAAQELLTRTGLLSDASMRSLVDLRGSSRNPISSRHLQVNMTTETRRNLNVLARCKLGGLAKVISLEADYGRHVEEQTEFSVTIKVDF